MPTTINKFVFNFLCLSYISRLTRNSDNGLCLTVHRSKTKVKKQVGFFLTGIR